MKFDREKPYNLTHLPPKVILDNPKIAANLLKARVALAELKGYSFSMPNPLLLLSPAILRESVASSEIENIHSTIVEVLQTQLFPHREQRESDREVLRYRDAIIYGFEQMRRFPLVNRIIIGVQKKLIPSSHGEYRTLQNAVENEISHERIYTPPVAGDVPILMNNWEIFMNKKDESIDPLIKAAIGHYQFEAIHPFRDGNGRTGRMLIVLYLVQEEILIWPILYISGYLNKNRKEYYSALQGVTEENKWEEFIVFILKGFYTQAKETNAALFSIMGLFEQFKERLKTKHRKIYTADLVEALFSYPIISPVKLSRELKIHYTTASRYLKELAKAGILGENIAGKYHLYFNKDLLRVMEKK
jgi:Fic family protein